MIAWLTTLRPEWRMGVAVFLLLSLASLIIGLLRWRNPGRDFRELRARTNAWWVMAGLIFFTVWLPDGRALVLFALMSFWAFKEYITLLKTRPADHKALACAFLAIPVQYWWIHMHWYGMFIIFIPVYVFLLLPVLLVLKGETTGFIASAAQLQWGLMAFVFGLSHLGWAVEPAAARGGVTGQMLLLFLIFTVEISDVLQYVWGKTLGRHKILPTVSPNKTWEGCLGGILTASAFSLLFRFLTPFSLVETFGVALMVTNAGFFGGAVMSAVKRDFGVKDFGTLIPGHGGLLDRIDSLCYAAPVFFHYLRYYHHA